jgi:hypothetical protein
LADATRLGSPQGLSIEDFRGDFDEVAALVQRSWMENSNQSLMYTPDFVASYFEYPGSSFALAPTLYGGNRPLAFIAGFPRRLKVQGRELNVILSSFLSVSSEYKKKGYGVVL